MATHIAFLRAVNVGGTGKLPMETLRAMCVESGFENPRTYIASGNLVFESEKSQDSLRTELEQNLEAFTGHKPGLIMRTPEELDTLLAQNPFPDEAGNKVIALLLDQPPSQADLTPNKHLKTEQIRAYGREVYIFYPEGQGQSKLKLPAQDLGTARNMNTFEKMKQLVKNG